MHKIAFVEMFVWFLYFATCLCYAVGSDSGLARRVRDNKHPSAQLPVDKNGFKNETRDRRAPIPSAKPSPDSLDPVITKRQFMPIVPDMPRRDFLPRREFEGGNLLPTPRLIRPMDLEPRGPPLERGPPLDRGPLPFERGSILGGPIDLEHKPFVGQGLIGPPRLPEFRRLEVPRRPLLQEPPPHLIPMNPELEPRHIFLEPHSRHFLGPSHLIGDRFGSLGDTPLIDMPRRHRFTEGFIAPQLPERLPESFTPAVRHGVQENMLPVLPHRLREHFMPRIHLPGGLIGRAPQRLQELPRLQHRLQEIGPIMHGLQESRLEHGLQEAPLEPVVQEAPLVHGLQETSHPTPKHRFVNFEPSPDPAEPADDNSDGDDSIEGMMNELSHHKTRKQWVTDVNIFDKKRKMDDIANFLDGDDKDDTDEDFGKFVHR